jgi:polar amino acid transport system substrate-binding protein
MKKNLVGIAALLAAGALALAGCSDTEADETTSGGSETSVSADGGPSDCVPAHPFETITAGVLTSASPEFPPFSTLLDSAMPGIDTEIAQAIADMECLGTEIQEVAYSAAIPAVQSNRADIAVGCYYRTVERVQVVCMSTAIYLDGMGVVSKDGLTSLEEIIKLNVGTVDGYLWNDDMQKLMDGQMKTYPSNVEMWADLNAGRIDVGFDSVAVSEAKAKGTDFKVTTAAPDDRVAASVKAAQIGLPYTKDATALETALNEDIKTLQDNGTIKAIFEKYGVDTSLTEVGTDYLIGE